MSIGLRDQRVSVYGYSDAGSDGWQTTRYTRINNPASADAAYWARKEPVSAREAQIALQAQHEVTVVFAFADHVFIPTDGVLKHGDTFYKITGTYIARMLRETVVHAIEAGDEIYNDIIQGIAAQSSFTLSPTFSATGTVEAAPAGILMASAFTLAPSFSATGTVEPAGGGGGGSFAESFADSFA